MIYLVKDKFYGIEEEFNNLEEAEQYCHEAEIVCYNEAIRYLTQEDPSFIESMELMIDYGYTELRNINSEVVATAHYQHKLISNIYKVEEDV